MAADQVLLGFTHTSYRTSHPYTLIRPPQQKQSCVFLAQGKRTQSQPDEPASQPHTHTQYCTQVNTHRKTQQEVKLFQQNRSVLTDTLCVDSVSTPQSVSTNAHPLRTHEHTVLLTQPHQQNCTLTGLLDTASKYLLSMLQQTDHP